MLYCISMRLRVRWCRGEVSIEGHVTNDDGCGGF